MLQCVVLIQWYESHSCFVQRVAVCCSVLQCDAACCSVLHLSNKMKEKFVLVPAAQVKTRRYIQRRGLCVAACCRVLQCVAVFCSVLQSVAACCCMCSVTRESKYCAHPAARPVCCSALRGPKFGTYSDGGF